jgi:hypothetical protein
MPHDVVLQKFGLVRRQIEFNIAAHAGVDAVNARAARQLFFERDAALADQGARGFSQFDHALAAGGLFDVFDREGAGAYDEGGEGGRHECLFYCGRSFRFAGLMAGVIA